MMCVLHLSWYMLSVNALCRLDIMCIALVDLMLQALIWQVPFSLLHTLRNNSRWINGITWCKSMFAKTKVDINKFTTITLLSTHTEKNQSIKQWHYISVNVFQDRFGDLQYWTSTWTLTSEINWKLTLRLLMSYIYGAPILDVFRSHITTQHSR